MARPFSKALGGSLGASALALLVTGGIGITPVVAQPAAAPTIVIVGDMKTGMPDAEHDFPDGALKLERLIKASPDFEKVKPVLKVFPVGFPKDLAEIADASVVVLYMGTHRTEAGSNHPIQAPAVKAAMAKLMDRGVGLVALHQSFTVPAADSGVPCTDYTVETAPVAVTAKSHPIARGLTAFNYLDEFYPTVDFGRGAKVTPVLTARVHVQHRKSDAVFEEPAKDRVIAWTNERANGGRAFAFSGGHYLASFDQPQVRTMVLNAILWAAKAEVPAAGVTTTIPALPRPGQPLPVVPHRVVLPGADNPPMPQPWGKLEWFASRALGNSTTMTVGRATIPAGQANPAHWHPNCDEVLFVQQGHIMHRVGDKEYEMRAGDTVVIPEGTVHNARNIGKEDAILMVSFNSADRVSLGE
jgi:quercetin dioxygenase-like cupin family protein/type 1 glutamine amidotransferase